jgi:hypothetical protein
MAMDGDDNSICSTEELEKYESLHQQEVGHTRVYDVNLLKMVGMDEEPPLILRTIGWGKLTYFYDFSVYLISGPYVPT